MAQHPLQGSGLGGDPCFRRCPTAFEGTQSLPLIHRRGHELLLRTAIRPASAHLRRQIVGMGVHITLGAAIRLELLKGREPTVDPGVGLTQCKPLEVGERRIHALHVGDEHQIGGARCCPARMVGIEPAATTSGDRLLHLGGHPLELIPGTAFLVLAQAWGAEPHTPGAEQQPFQLTQTPHPPVMHASSHRPESAFKGLEDAIALRDQATIEFQSRQHSRGNQCREPGLLRAIAAHGDLADPIGHPAQLKPEPHLLAVRAPGVVVPEQGHLHVCFGMPEQPQAGLGVGGAFHAFGSSRCQSLQSSPGERLRLQRIVCHHANRSCRSLAARRRRTSV